MDFNSAPRILSFKSRKSKKVQLIRYLLLLLTTTSNRKKTTTTKKLQSAQRLIVRFFDLLRAPASATRKACRLFIAQTPLLEPIKQSKK